MDLPWLPTTPTFKPTTEVLPNGGKRIEEKLVEKRPPPALLPITSPSSPTTEDRIQAQISINTKIMQDNEVLKEERLKILKAYEQSNKEKEMFKMKLTQATEKLEYMKKKFGKNQVANVENINPNTQQNYSNVNDNDYAESAPLENAANAEN